MEHVGIDLGARKSQVCIRAADGTILKETAFATARLRQLLEKRPRSRVVLESSSEAFSVADIARRCGHEVVVVPSTLVKALGVGARGVKNDQKDARATSVASCQMTSLPSVHVPDTRSRSIKAMCTSREALVKCRTKLINTVRSWMRTQLLVLSRVTPATFPQHVRTLLLEEEDGIPTHIEAILSQIEALSDQVKALTADVHRLAKEDDVCARLMTVPGVGPITAVRFFCAVDDVSRFADAHRVESYFGLTPGERVTGFKGHRTGVTKAGQSAVRWTLVQAAWSAMRCRKQDPMVIWALNVAERRGKQVAAVALARKIAGVLYALWRDGSTYSATHEKVSTKPHR